MGNNFMLIGVTGGVGAGKSTVLNYLEHSYNCTVFVTDMIAYSIMREDKECFETIKDVFAGYDILNTAGSIDSFKVGRVIFKDAGMREQMNKIVHPRVIQYVLDKCMEVKQIRDFAIVESALLIESGLYESCDRVWVVTAQEKNRIQRLMKGRGYAKKKCENIIASQLSMEGFSVYASDIISTDCTYQQTYDRVDEICSSYGYGKKLPPVMPNGRGIVDAMANNFS